MQVVDFRRVKTVSHPSIQHHIPNSITYSTPVPYIKLIPYPFGHVMNISEISYSIPISIRIWSNCTESSFSESLYISALMGSLLSTNLHQSKFAFIAVVLWLNRI